jgi:hypothetical protein
MTKMISDVFQRFLPDITLKYSLSMNRLNMNQIIQEWLYRNLSVRRPRSIHVIPQSHAITYTNYVRVICIMTDLTVLRIWTLLPNG